MVDRRLRPSMLDSARRASRQQVVQRAKALAGPSSTVMVGVLRKIERPDEVSKWRADVDLSGGLVSLPANPGPAYVVGGGVRVQVEEGRPTLVLGPTDTPVPDATGPTTVREGAVPVLVAPDMSIDPAARARNEEVAAEVEQAREGLETASDLITALRERVGRKMYVGDTFTVKDYTRTTVDYLRVQPLGGGKVRFVALTPGPHTGWQVTDSTPLGDGSEYTHTFTAPGTYWVRYRTPDGAGDYLWQNQVTVTADMMDPDYGWVDMEWPDLDLSDLTAAGGPLDPAVLAELWEQVVVGGFLVATEAIIGPEALIDGAVTARTLNAVDELPDGSRLSVKPDGVRMWRAGNTGPTPNVALTTVDGFRMWDNNGNPTAWIDAATGTLRLAGAVQSGGRVSGAELEVRNPAGDIVFSATPHGGVVIGGGGAVYQNAGPLVTDGDSVWITEPVPVTPGATYGWRFRAQSSPAFTSEQNYVAVVFQIGTATHSEAITTHGTFPTIGSTQGVIESQLVAPAGASSMRLQYRRTDQAPPLPPDQYVQFTDIRITAVAAGTVDIGGSVKAPRGVFNRLEVDRIRGSNGIAYDPSDTGWMTFNLSGDWTAQGLARRRKQGSRVWLRGELMALNPAAGSGRPITTLPAGWRPAQRLRIPWGWGDSLTYVVVETDGTVWSGPNARTTAPGMSLDVITFTTDD